MKNIFHQVRKGKHQNLFWTTYTLVLMITAIVGALGGLLFGYAIDLPQVEQLQETRPNIVSYVYSQNGRTLGQFALEKRILITYEKIPDMLKKAILAIEDADFFEHSGIDFQRLLVTLFRDIYHGERKGASTLTMQLSKLVFTGSEKTIERKIKDMLFALEIEKNYTKQQIFTFYCNQIYMGHGTYGIASAADFYFNKSLDQLTLAESALLAGVIQVPERHSPINYPDRTLRRRNTVLVRMYDEGFIDEPTFQDTVTEPIIVRGKNYNQSTAPYFVEWVRQRLGKNYSTEQIWEGGLKIRTTVDYIMQKAARRALREGLKTFDKERFAWQGPIENILEQGKDLDTYFHPEWRQIFYEGQMVRGLVIESDAKQAQVKIGSYVSVIEPDAIAWTGEERVNQVLKPGDIAIFLIESIHRDQKKIRAVLDRIPEVQGALIAIDNKTGAIRAMVGGFDFQYSKFNRSTQALRQAGSLFKPFTYVAVLEAGFSPHEQVLDAPVSFRDGLGRLYEPENSDQEFKGLIPIRQAFAGSRNVPTIRLANALGVEKIIEVAKRFGIRREFPPFLPVALGAGELTLQEIVSAFSAFPNNGVRADPYFVQRVEDYNGSTLEEHQNAFEQTVSPEIASTMLFLLRSVVQIGTGRQALSLNRPIGGKTGTTNDYTDSWFVGFTPEITAGVWAGYDEKKSLGEKVYGATLALPVWIDFMQEIHQDQPVMDFENNFSKVALNVGQRQVEDKENGDSKQETARTPLTVEDIPVPPQ